jgi:4-amino-4-deoxy-L-arabinose transferase-like glycosyltransferase
MNVEHLAQRAYNASQPIGLAVDARADAQARRWLLSIVAVAVLLRLGAALAMGDHVEVLPGINDQVSYDALARSLLAGRGFTFPTSWWPATPANTPTAFWSFLYTLYLAGVYGVFGVHPLVARLIQAIVAGLLGPWLIYRIGRRVFGSTAGLVAAGLMAVYIYFVYYNAALMTETFHILATLWALDLTMALAENLAWRRWALLGLALGIAVLLRQVILFFVPFLLLWLLWAGRGRVRLRHLAVPLLVILMLILPWTVRNYLAFHRFVLLNTNAGFAFFWANHPIYGTNYVPLLPANGPSYQDLIPQELRGLDEAALDNALLRRGIGFVLDDPLRYALLSVSRIKDYFKFWPSPDSSFISNISRTLSFGLCLPFMIYGLILSLPVWRRCSLLYLFMGVYTLIHLLSWASIRYRLPVDAVLIVFAGLAIADLLGRLSRHIVAGMPGGV